MTTDAAAENQKAQSRAVFNQLAQVYDSGPGCFAYFGARLVDAADLAPRQRVLDVACGRGAVLFPAAERVGPQGMAVGIDLSEEMVQATRAESAQRGLTVSVQVGDAEQLEFDSASFDRVLCGFGVMFFPRLERALAEFRRVLKPGGLVAVSMWQVAQADDAQVVLDRLFPSTQNVARWITQPEQLSGLLGEAGFEDARVASDAHTFHYPSFEHYWQAVRGTGLRRRLDALDADQTQRLQAALVEHLGARQRADGLYIEASAALAVARSASSL
jgi:ubiquinone/menaquinone biosynthesis C-methylase UbiE